MTFKEIEKAKKIKTFLFILSTCSVLCVEENSGGIISKTAFAEINTALFFSCRTYIYLSS